MRHVTLLTSVNTWECDENAHMNVQFYFAKFDDANRIFCAKFPLSSLTRDNRLTRHVRYHREAGAAAMIEICSALVMHEGRPAGICHFMNNAADKALMATALDTYQPDALEQISASPDIPLTNWSEISEAHPRGLNVSPATQSATGHHKTPTYSGILHPRDFAADGTLLDRAYISCFTDGAPHSWSAGGITPAFLNSNNFGRVAVELKLTYGANAQPGAIVDMTTAFQNVGKTTFTVRHTLTSDGKIIAYGDLVSLMMDLELRKAVALPVEADRMRQLATIQ
ncbi:acyl-ACP thioesterase [Pararhizobium sp. IMCC21322]|uniref:acyl-ACP thioesterase n=1 Tax=Pararhizobium sp. IMCC21322 TaxID=3067903 RepID=UPI0027417E9E|nr:acyl-ACP thioesterase [Pararhizobium sp. IMCC21322]